MKNILLIVFSFIVFSCSENKSKVDQKIIDRIEFVYQLKERINQDVWKTFNQKEFDVPLIYYTDSTSYIANPTEKFKSIFHPNLVYENGNLSIYKTGKLLDSIPFHMETGMSLGDTTDEYDYHSPFMKCSSFELTKKAIPVVKSTEQWTTMIIHEYFHGFQYKHPAYIDFYEKNIVQIQPDSLISIYKNNPWFKESIDQENDLLLQAINETDRIKTNLIITKFFALREERRALTKKNLLFDIAKYESCYETMEGTARYVEYSLYTKFSQLHGEEKLQQSDTSFHAFKQYQNYRIENDPWLYQTTKTTYFYATGFNMARLLDKLNSDYKMKIFIQGGITLEDILNLRNSK